MELPITTVVDLYKEAHDSMRKIVTGLDPVGLAWVPGPETNPISVLIVHALGSEADVLRVVRGLPLIRDRDSEFVRHEVTSADLLARLDAADALLDEHAAAMTAADLSALRERPPRPPQTGLRWLLGNYGHAREHLAHLELTAQLYRQADAATS